MNTLAPRESRRRPARIGMPAAFAALILVGACASTPPPTEQVAVSEAAVANALGAGAVELAPAQMRTAQDKLHRASVAMIAKDYGVARSLAEEAQVDAQLAVVMARSSKARKAAGELREDTRVLREEIERKAK